MINININLILKAIQKNHQIYIYNKNYHQIKQIKQI